MNEEIHRILIEEEADRAISALFIPPSNLGYSFLKTAVLCGVIEPMSVTNLRKGAYALISKRYNTTEAHIERDIRHAIKVASLNGGLYTLNEMLNEMIYSGDERITVSNLICYLVNYVKNQVNRKLVGFTKDDEDEFHKAQIEQNQNGKQAKIKVTKISSLQNLF